MLGRLCPLWSPTILWLMIDWKTRSLYNAYYITIKSSILYTYYNVNNSIISLYGLIILCSMKRSLKFATLLPVQYMYSKLTIISNRNVWLSPTLNLLIEQLTIPVLSQFHDLIAILAQSHWCFHDFVFKMSQFSEESTPETSA